MSMHEEYSTVPVEREREYPAPAWVVVGNLFDFKNAVLTVYPFVLAIVMMVGDVESSSEQSEISYIPRLCCQHRCSLCGSWNQQNSSIALLHPHVDAPFVAAGCSP